MSHLLRSFLTIGLAMIAPHVARAAEPVRIVCFGDSVTKAVRQGVRPSETFSAILERTLNDAGRQVEVINAGVGGNTTGHGLDRFERDVLAHEPDYVVIMFGLNDSWIDDGRSTSRVGTDDYRDNLQQMISLLRQRGAGVVLMTPNPAIAPKYPPERNTTLKSYVAAVRELARAERLELVDVYRRFAELAIEGEDLNALFTDAMHPNPAGQRLIAGMLSARFQTLLAARDRQLANSQGSQFACGCRFGGNAVRTAGGQSGTGWRAAPMRRRCKR